MEITPSKPPSASVFPKPSRMEVGRSCDLSPKSLDLLVAPGPSSVGQVRECVLSCTQRCGQPPFKHATDLGSFGRGGVWMKVIAALKVRSLRSRGWNLRPRGAYTPMPDSQRPSWALLSPRLMDLPGGKQDSPMSVPRERTVPAEG